MRNKKKVAEHKRNERRRSTEKSLGRKWPGPKGGTQCIAGSGKGSTKLSP